MKNIVVILLAVFSSMQAGELITFKDTSNGTWNDFKQTAAQEHKLIFVDAYTDWCSWCKVMDKETFPDSSVAEFMNKNFVNVHYEMETGFGMTMAAKYRVSGFPSFLIFTSDGKLVYRIVGYYPAKDFLKKLNESLDSVKHDNLVGVSDELDPGFPDFYKISFGKKENRVRTDSATVNSYLASVANLSTEAPYSVMFRFYSLLAPQYKQYIVEHVDTLKYLYGKSDVDYLMNGYVRSKLMLAIKNNNEEALAEVLMLSKKYFPEEAASSESNYRIQFYLGTNQWQKFADAVDAGITAGTIEENGTNNYSWTIYERCDDKKIIARAAGWMEKVVGASPKYMFTDTYAALLFKNGNLKKAKTFAEKAIAQGKEEKEDVAETEALLKKINTSLNLIKGK
jgi:thioredoxin-related protein